MDSYLDSYLVQAEEESQFKTVTQTQAHTRATCLTSTKSKPDLLGISRSFITLGKDRSMTKRTFSLQIKQN